MKQARRILKRKENRNRKPLIVPLSSMIDVIFLLLMFFVMTHRPSLLEAFATVKHPGKGAGVFREHIRIRVQPGQYHLMDARRSLPEIEDWLVSSKSLVSDFTVIIKVSPNATEGEFVAVLDMCSKLGLTNLNVMTLKE